MIRWLKKIDSIVFVLILTIIIGVAVITLRSKTYTVGYEIAKLKANEKSLRKQNAELHIQLSQLQKKIRERLLNQNNTAGQKKFIFPDTAHVIIEENTHEKRN